MTGASDKFIFYIFRPYGVVLSAAILMACLVILKEIKRKKEDVDDGLNMILWGLAAGLLGARFYHVFHLWDYYSKKPELILNVWRGGMGIYGAIIGAGLAVFIYSKIKKLDFLKWADIASLGAPLGQAIGRWANFLMEELYGKPTSLPWGFYVRKLRRPEGYENFTHFHPLFLYESILNFLNFLVVFYLSRKGKIGQIKLKKGELFLIYVSNYAMIRFFLEFLRPSEMVWRFLGLPMAQLIGILVVSGAGISFYLRRK